jgi:hypothetical protein
VDLDDVDDIKFALAIERGPAAVRAWMEGGVRMAKPPPPHPLSSVQISPLQIEGPSITWAKGGRSVKVKIPQGPRKNAAQGDRKPCRIFTGKSRRALLHSINSIDEGRVQVAHLRFITLTYPAAFPSASASKRDLDNIIKRFVRAYGARALWWKLEPQKRGAPHFHLLVLMGSNDTLQEEIEWWSHEWHELAGGGDRHHLRWHLGQLRNNKPCVEVVHTWRQVQAYVGKYLGKLPEDDSCTWHEPGRFWGLRAPQLLPRTIQREEVPLKVAHLVRRSIVRWFEHQPTNFYRCRNAHEDDRGQLVEHGKVMRVRLTAAQAAEYIGLVTIRPYHRRWKQSRGGVSAFMPAAVLERIVTWAKSEASSFKPRPPRVALDPFAPVMASCQSQN